MAKFYNLEIKEVRQETNDAVSIAFRLNDEQKKAFQFIPGQYLTLRAEIEGEDVRRSYSICSSPYLNEDLRIAVKRVPFGKFSNYASGKLKKGDVLEVMPPMGNFHCKIDANNKKKYVAFAAGSGITPVISILKSVLAEEKESTFTLFYGNQSFNSIIFREEIEDLKNRYLSRLEAYHILSREDPGIRIFKGRMDAEKCQQIFRSFPHVLDADEYFICGPEEMIKNVSDLLGNQKIEKNKIHFELFTTPSTNLGKTNQVVTKSPTESFSSTVRLIIDGEETQFGLNSDGVPILDAALQNGIDVPYACKGAVCCTCKAKVIEGKVRMDMNYSLEDDELEAGYVLTCQSHPESKDVVIDFDS